MNKATLTVIIAGKNKEPQMGICANSVSIADDTPVLDSGRSNGTAAQSRRVAATAHILYWAE